MDATSVLIALHIIAVLAAYGLPLAYPLMLPYVRARSPEAMPGIHDVQLRLNRVLTGPGTILVLGLGIWAAVREDVMDEPFVQAGFAAIAIIAVTGGWIVKASRQMAELSRADVAAAGPGGAVTWSPEYERLYARYLKVEAFLGFVVIAAVFVMATKPGT